MRLHLTRDQGPNGHFKFAWTRFTQGSRIEERCPEWLRDSNPNYREEVLVYPVDGGRACETYYPMQDEPGLVLRFAKIKTADDVLGFADAYGWLGLIHDPTRGFGSRSWEPGGESVPYWLLEALRVERVLRVWSLLEANNTPALRRIIHWDGNYVAARFDDGQPEVPIVDAATGTAGWLRRWKPGEVTGPAKLFLIEQFNRKMTNMASPILLLDSKRDFKPYVYPVNLLAAMWLEFSQIVTGVKILRRCESCGRTMDVSENRSHKRMHDHCSIRERMRRYRAKGKNEKG